MRTLLVAALLLLPAVAIAEEAPKALSIALEPLGDVDQSVVARVFFRFANPRQVTDAGLFLEGSLTQNGRVPRNFRFPVPRRNDKWVWNNIVERNGKIVRRTRWAILPDQRNEMAVVHTFDPGAVEIDVRLVLEGDYGRPAKLVSEATETFTLAKTNQPFPATVTEAEPEVPEGEAAEEMGAVAMRPPRHNTESKLYMVSVDVLPPVKRVEFWVRDKKVLARNAPPYTADLDLGDSPDPVALRAIGFDAKGSYVDADAFVVNDSGERVTVTITRTASPDGMSHFKLSVQNPKRTPLKSVALYADDRKLHEWDRPPYTLSVPNTSLEGAEFVRASVIDETGSEATDRQVVNIRRDGR